MQVPNRAGQGVLSCTRCGRPTERSTCAKQYAATFSKEGIIKYFSDLLTLIFFQYVTLNRHIFMPTEWNSGYVVFSCLYAPGMKGTATPMAHIDPVFNLRFGEYRDSSV